MDGGQAAGPVYRQPVLQMFARSKRVCSVALVCDCRCDETWRGRSSALRPDRLPLDGQSRAVRSLAGGQTNAAREQKQRRRQGFAMTRPTRRQVKRSGCRRRWCCCWHTHPLRTRPLAETSSSSSSCCWCGVVVARINRLRDQSFPHGKLRHRYFLGRRQTSPTESTQPSPSAKHAVLLHHTRNRCTSRTRILGAFHAAGLFFADAHRSRVIALAVHEPIPGPPPRRLYRALDPDLRRFPPRPRNHGSRPQEDDQHCASPADRRRG